MSFEAPIFNLNGILNNVVRLDSASFPQISIFS